MSFKDELVKKVVQIRDAIKSNAVKVFTQCLKSAMYEVAEKGRTSGSLNIKDEYENCEEEEQEDEYYYVKHYIKLEELLLTTGEIKIKDETMLFVWLLEEIKKTSVFDGIYMEIENDELKFYWHTHE
jgi:hypothetical protein